MRRQLEFSIEGGWAIERHRHRGPTQAALNQGNTLNAQAGNQNQMSGQLFGTTMPAISKMVNNPGYTPAQQSAITTNTVGAATEPYAGAADTAARTAAASRNPAGLDTSLDALAREKSAAADTAANQAQIEIAQDAQQQQQQGISDAGQLFGTTEGTAGKLYNSATPLFGQQQQSPTGQILGSALGAAGVAACWVAAELYGGWEAEETKAIRAWLLATWYMIPFVAIYRRCGKRWARAIRTNRGLRVATKLAFDGFLKAARRGA